MIYHFIYLLDQNKMAMTCLKMMNCFWTNVNI